MARPLKEGMDYFPHDTDAANDEKIEVLRSLYGNDGYAFYFIMLERIYRSKNFEINVSDAETREETYQILSRKVSVTRERFDQILQTALKWGCFNQQWYDEKGIISSDGIKKRSGTVTEKRAAMRIKYNNKPTGVSASETTQETGEETPQSKVKESKVYIRAQHLSMTKKEYDKLTDMYGKRNVDDKIEYAKNYRKLKNYKSLYRTLNNWLKKDGKEQRPKGIPKDNPRPSGRREENLLELVRAREEKERKQHEQSAGS